MKKAGKAADPATQLASFDDVLKSEHASIAARLSRHGRPVTGRTGEWPGDAAEYAAAAAAASGAKEKSKLDPVYDTVGLALSGGGVRSAAVCLGAVQALAVAKAFPQIDYLSTVSGGGYLGSSLSAALSQGAEKTDSPFPLASRIAKDEIAAIQHIRDYSNYLIPHGFSDVLASIAIYLRGIAANILLVMPWLLLAAAVTLWVTPTRDSLHTGNLFGLEVPEFLSGHFFTLTGCFAFIFVILLLLWSLAKSFNRNVEAPEVPGGASTFFGKCLIVLGLTFFCELQPWVIAAVFDAAKDEKSIGSSVPAYIVSVLHYAVGILAPLAVAVGVWGNRLGSFIKGVGDTDGLTARALALGGKLAMLLSALVLPMVLWLIYLQLSYWGISKVSPAPSASQANWMEAYLAPVWMKDLAALVAPTDWRTPLAVLYAAGWLILFLASAFLAPNANSLHRLYRDRLSKAFLIRPQSDPTKENEPIPTLEKQRLDELTEKHGPYHLINAALNVQASKYANRRGRNADFFLFSRNYIGSETTKYAKTTDFWEKVPEVDLATAMAVSGAAASSNMGSSSIKQWTFSLAMLNVRLGYWLRNPRYIYGTSKAQDAWHELFNPYFLYELFGLLNEKRWFVNLSDGGHIENLGLYELLRRRCHVIIVIDAEADPKMNFGSFVTLQRYARIDLGVRIELPWNEIRMTTLDTSEKVKKADGVTQELIDRTSPHCAVGKIYYPNGEGLLLYVKSSMTGDENDYVMDYKRRKAKFPHETTGDQFFTEEQFEAYRALGFHSVFGFFSRRDSGAELENGLADEVITALTPPQAAPPTGQAQPSPVSPQPEGLKDPRYKAEE